MSATLRSRIRSESTGTQPSAGLVRARVVDERFEGVLDDLLGEGLRRVVRAGGRPGRRLDHDQAAGQDDRRAGRAGRGG